MARELVYDTITTHSEGDPVYYFEIYVKNEKGYQIIDESQLFYDEMDECNQAAEERIKELEVEKGI